MKDQLAKALPVVAAVLIGAGLEKDQVAVLGAAIGLKPEVSAAIAIIAGAAGAWLSKSPLLKSESKLTESGPTKTETKKEDK